MQYWSGAHPPAEILLRMNQCKAQNKSLKYKCFDSASAANCLNRWYGSEIANILLSIRMEAMRSDVFRVAWLLQKGGFYVDATSEVLEPFSKWIDKDRFTLLRKKSKICNTQ